MDACTSELSEVTCPAAAFVHVIVGTNIARRGSYMAETAPLVLIADDDEDNREMYAGYLSAHGFRVAEARDGGEAVTLAKQLQPALVVLDLHMPRLDGIAATRRIRRAAQIRNTPVLVLTADDTQDQAALRAGANAVCVKPCMPDALLTQIRRLLSG